MVQILIRSKVIIRSTTVIIIRKEAEEFLAHGVDLFAVLDVGEVDGDFEDSFPEILFNDKVI